MWKLIIAFVVFAAAAIYILTKAGGDVDMGGEKHSVEAPHGAASAAGAHDSASAPAAPASAAAAASAASKP